MERRPQSILSRFSRRILSHEKRRLFSLSCNYTWKGLLQEAPQISFLVRPSSWENVGDPRSQYCTIGLVVNVPVIFQTQRCSEVDFSLRHPNGGVYMTETFG